MMISLPLAQHTWLSAHVAEGDFASVEEAVRQLIDERIAGRAAEEADHLAWAEPYMDEALAQAARGDMSSREGHCARNAARLATFKD